MTIARVWTCPPARGCQVGPPPRRSPAACCRSPDQTAPGRAYVDVGRGRTGSPRSPWLPTLRTTFHAGRSNATGSSSANPNCHRLCRDSYRARSREHGSYPPFRCHTNVRNLTSSFWKNMFLAIGRSGRRHLEQYAPLHHVEDPAPVMLTDDPYGHLGEELGVESRPLSHGISTPKRWPTRPCGRMPDTDCTSEDHQRESAERDQPHHCASKGGDNDCAAAVVHRSIS